MNIKKYRVDEIIELLAQSSPLLGERVVAIVDRVDSGKTTTMLRLVEHVKTAGLTVGGVLQLAYYKNGCKIGYVLEDLATGQQCPLAERNQDGIGFHFNPAAWQWAHEVISEAVNNCDIVVVDELGRLEAQGKGHMPALVANLQAEVRWFLVIRDDCYSDIITFLRHSSSRP